MRGFFRNRPAVGHKNTPGRKIWLTAKDGTKFAVNTGGRRRGPSLSQLTYSVTHLIVGATEARPLGTGWIRFDHRLERKRWALCG